MALNEKRVTAIPDAAKNVAKPAREEGGGNTVFHVLILRILRIYGNIAVRQGVPTFENQQFG